MFYELLMVMTIACCFTFLIYFCDVSIETVVFVVVVYLPISIRILLFFCNSNLNSILTISNIQLISSMDS